MHKKRFREDFQGFRVSDESRIKDLKSPTENKLFAVWPFSFELASFQINFSRRNHVIFKVLISSEHTAYQELYDQKTGRFCLVLLSLEKHCRIRPTLISKQAEFFIALSVTEKALRHRRERSRIFPSIALLISFLFFEDQFPIHSFPLFHKNSFKYFTSKSSHLNIGK